MTDERKQAMRQVFDSIAGDYDILPFTRLAVERLIALAPISPGARLLDVATGTGLAAIAAAYRVGPGGTILGVDISPGMLRHARQNAARSHLGTLTFVEGDAERLDLPDGTFDGVICASSLFLIPDMDAAVAEWRRVVKPGGFAAFTSFGPGLLEPLRAMWEAGTANLGLQSSVPPMGLPDAASCKAILERHGFERVESHAEDQACPIESADEWWRINMAGLSGLALRSLSDEARATFQRDHLAEVEAYATANPLQIEVPLNIAIGWKPSGT
ncbi:MAG TPA: methyltransferase domain-containing protein [Tepidiformaceae bacterium]|nr:methyltransferase domain-containing protein [Tepidiformaceae bacterium]